MSTKQVAHTVVDGKLIIFRPFPTFPDFTITGYVYGMDDYHWAVVEPSGAKHLVHKGAPIFTLADESTFDSEPLKESLTKLVGPFRRYVEENFFGRNGADPARDEDEREPAPC